MGTVKIPYIVFTLGIVITISLFNQQFKPLIILHRPGKLEPVHPGKVQLHYQQIKTIFTLDRAMALLYKTISLKSDACILVALNMSRLA